MASISEEQRECFSRQMGLTAGQIGGQIAPKAPPLGRLHSALDRLRKTASITAEATDRLCGPQPEASSGAQAMAANAGVFDEIENVADEIDAIADRISSRMQRIQSRL